MPSQDYTKKFGNQLRDKTIAGLLSNMIREVQNQSPLFQTTALGGLAGAGGGSSGECGLSTSGNASFTVPTNDTGSVAVQIQVCSSVAQTATFVASFAGPQPSCLGTPTVFPSTLTFTAGQCQNVVITVPYTNCSNSYAGAGFTVSLVGTTGSGCVSSNLLSSLAGGGGGTISSKPLAVFEVALSFPSCDPTFGVWGGAASNSGTGDPCWGITPVACGDCPLHCSSCTVAVGFEFRARSVNGFSGTVSYSCGGGSCGGSINPCAGIGGNVGLTSGQSVVLVTGVFPGIPVVGNYNGINIGASGAGMVSIGGAIGAANCDVQIC